MKTNYENKIRILLFVLILSIKKKKKHLKVISSQNNQSQKDYFAHSAYAISIVHLAK